MFARSALRAAALAPPPPRAPSLFRAPAFFSRSLCAAAAEFLTGRCKWWDSTRGFGFITVDGEERDVFAHHSKLHADGFRSLAEGEPVEFELQEDRKTGKVGALHEHPHSLGTRLHHT